MDNSGVAIVIPFEEYKHSLRGRLDSAKREPSLADSLNYNQKDRSGLFTRTKLPSSICPSDRMSVCGRQPLRKGPSTKNPLNLKINQKLEQIKRTCLRPKERTNSQVESDEESIAESVDMEMEKQPKRNRCFIRKSKYLNRPASVHFDYPKCCNLENIHNPNEIVPWEGNPELKYRLTGHEYKCILNALEHNGFTRTYSSKEWNVYFDVACRELKTLAGMNKFQKISHFPGCWVLGRKDYMWKVLQKMRRKSPSEYDFVPNTYVFPSDFDRFQVVREGASKEHLWIMKPAAQACGRGIKMITRQTKIKPRKDYLVSEYVKNPHLINGLKYDLRIYVVVLSYDPLKIYMFDQGLTRFATQKYSTKLKQVKKRFIHLTNFSVNKRSKLFVKDQGDGRGSKWSLTTLREYYRAQGIDDELVFSRIKDVIVKTCIAAESSMLDIHSKSQERRTCGFQLYGFDILIDDNLKPWLMEVNVCPSLSSSSPMDRKIKHTLLVDLLNLVGMEIFDRKKYQEDKKKEKERILTGQSQRKTFFSKNIHNLSKLTFDNCVELLSPQDWLLLFQLQEEQCRKGHFELIFPVRQTMSKYLDLFQFPRYNNQMIWHWLNSPRNYLEHLT